MNTLDKSTVQILKALSNKNRLQIMHWLSQPRDHFPPQQDGDLVEDGVCVGFITEKTGLTQPTVTSHMNELAAAGLVSSKRIKNWVFYKPEKDQLRQALNRLADELCASAR